MGRFREFGKKCIGCHRQGNYWQQAIKKRQKAQMASQSLGITAVTAWLYYRSGWAVLILCPLGIRYYQSLKDECIERKKSEFLLQFKEMIQSMASTLGAGYSVENAVKETYKEMLLMYSREDMISRELAIMVQQVHIQIPVEQILEEFSNRVRLEDIQSFSAVFGAAKRSGGDMIGIIRDSVHQIGDKIDVRREIDTLLAAKRYEFKVMSVIPYGIIAYMTLSFPEFMECLYGNVIGIGVMSVCLGIYITAYVFGVKLVKIEV